MWCSIRSVLPGRAESPSANSGCN
uniref:Uncharacterized protein n=1 Tax=Anguilla anguilla TaxID=7936 RepID=A0A0E9QGF0_ANGAN